jgi:hypothetical protein
MSFALVYVVAAASHSGSITQDVIKTFESLWRAT